MFHNILTDIKNELKKSTLLFELNAKYKCYKIKRQYHKIDAYYSAKEPKGAFEELLKQKGFTQTWAKQFEARKQRVFYIGTDESQDKSGFLQELGKTTDLKYFTKEDASYGAYKHKCDCSDIKTLKFLTTLRLKELLNNFSREGWIPDIVLMQSWGIQFILKEFIDLKEKYGFKVINIGMDERHTFYLEGKKEHGTYGLIPLLDLSLVSSPEAVEWYIKEGIPSLFFPEASSLAFYHPLDVIKKYDVGFIGAKYGLREKIVDALNRNGIPVQCYGSGWAEGKLPLEQVNRFFNECRIVLGVGTIGYCNDFYSLKLRDFDVPMSGSTYITQNNIDLTRLFEPEKEVVFYHTIDDLIKKVKYLLVHTKERESIARNGHEKAKACHTYEKRFKDLFGRLGMVN